MSRTFSSCSRERSWKGSEAVTSASTSSTSHSSSAAIETRCWASTSSGFCGITVSSISPFAHPPRDDRALEQVGAELGEDAAARDLAQRVAGAADPLQAAADRLRRLDLDHQVDRPHVDPQLQGRGRHQAGQLPGLQHLLDDSPLLVGEGAVVGAGDLAGLAAAPRCRRGSEGRVCEAEGPSSTPQPRPMPGVAACSVAR